MWAAESNEGKADSGFKDMTGCRAKAPIEQTFRMCISTFLAFPIGSDALLMALRALGSEIGLVFDDILRDVNGGVSFLRSRVCCEGERSPRPRLEGRQWFRLASHENRTIWPTPQLFQGKQEPGPAVVPGPRFGAGGHCDPPCPRAIMCARMESRE